MTDNTDNINDNEPNRMFGYVRPDNVIDMAYVKERMLKQGKEIDAAMSEALTGNGYIEDDDLMNKISTVRQMHILNMLIGRVIELMELSTKEAIAANVYRMDMGSEIAEINASLEEIKEKCFPIKKENHD